MPDASVLAYEQSYEAVHRTAEPPTTAAAVSERVTVPVTVPVAADAGTVYVNVRIKQTTNARAMKVSLRERGASLRRSVPDEGIA
jgi:hypothetical protein